MGSPSFSPSSPGFFPAVVRLSSELSFATDTPPLVLRTCDGAWPGAHDRIRTGDLVLTKDVLYLLSYVSRSTVSSLAPRSSGAGNGTRTRDPELGRLVL
jgi:hypothetical protein